MEKRKPRAARVCPLSLSGGVCGSFLARKEVISCQMTREPSWRTLGLFPNRGYCEQSTVVSDTPIPLPVHITHPERDCMSFAALLFT